MTKSTQRSVANKSAIRNSQFAIPRRVGWSLILLGVILLVVWGVRLAQVGQALREHLAQAQALADAPEALDPAAACALVRDLRSDVVALRCEAGGLVRLAPALGWLPKVGADLRAAPHLLAVADGLTEAGALACDALEPALTAFGGTGEASGGFSLEQMVGLLAERQADLERARAAVERATAAWARVDTPCLSPRLARLTEPLDAGLPWLQLGLDAALVAPGLLGSEEPRTYMLIVQNSEELRATGGLISAVGLITLDRGRLGPLHLEDSYAVDDWSKPYPNPPEPLRRYMGIDLWVFRDANWWPDFPTSAQAALGLYHISREVDVDGVIAVDVSVLHEVLAGLEPLEVPGWEEPVTQGNVSEQTRRAWSPEGEMTGEWWRSRKQFMGDLVTAMREKVKNDPGSIDWRALAGAMQRTLEQRHLQVWLRDPTAATLMAERGWDGALRDIPGDYLMVVDTNMGYNKMNAVIEQSLEYRAVIDVNGSVQGKLTVQHYNPVSGTAPCDHSAMYGGGYEDMMARCYWDYLRVYVPQGSRLLSADTYPTPAAWLLTGKADPGTVQVVEDGACKTVFATFLVVPRSEQRQTRLIYALPEDITAAEDGVWHYRLYVQKQAGTVAPDLSVVVQLPVGASLVTARPEPAMVEDNEIVYQLNLATDQTLEVCFRMP